MNFRPLFWSLVSLATLAALPACGGRSALKVGPPPADGGVVDPTDLSVSCPALVYTSPRRELVVEVEVESTSEVVATAWSFGVSPPGSSPEFISLGEYDAAITQDLVGTYELIYEVDNADGRHASCVTQIESVVGPPIAICPEGPLQTGIGQPLVIEGDAYDDDGISSTSWAVTGPGDFELSDPLTLQPTFIAEAGGTYTATLTVVDIDRAIDSCDVAIQVTQPPTVICPAVVETSSFETIAIEAQAFDDTGIASSTFELIETPSEGRVTLSDVTQTGSVHRSNFRSNRPGSYPVRFTATDDDGLSASCETVVEVAPVAPTLTCPDVETRPLVRTDVPCTFLDDGEIVSWTWTLLDTPSGSASMPPVGMTSHASFLPDIAGEYILGVSVVDDQGFTVSAEVLVAAIATEGLRIEVTWNSAGDMDTHLLEPTGRQWGDDQLDCFYANCQRSGLDWGTTGVSDDDPSLDIDNTSGFGPENINIDTPVDGTYRVGVHAFSGASAVTVRVYCGGSTTVPRQTFGPVRVSDNRLWRVADVTVTGASCSISEIVAAGGGSDFTTANGPR